MRQTINQLNEKIQILQSDIASKDAAITSLEQSITERSNVTKELSMVIVIPSSDEIDHHGGRIVKMTVKINFHYFTLRRNWEHNIKR